MKIPQVGTNYLIEIDKEGVLDRVIVKTEINSKLFTGDISSLNRLEIAIKEQIRDTILVNPLIELHEPLSLPVSEGKAKRVIDNRPQI